MMAKVILAGLILIALMFTIACEVEPEATPVPPDVVLTGQGNAFTIKSELTPEQASGDADVLVSYPAVTHLLGETRGPVSRIPGRVIGWRTLQVEVIYPGQGEDEYIKVWVVYDKDFDPADLHDDKPNLASCRYEEPTGWPKFYECSKVN